MCIITIYHSIEPSQARIVFDSGGGGDFTEIYAS